MEYANKVSVIIPCNHGTLELQKIVQAICSQSVKPAEIVIVDSSECAHDVCPAEIVDLCRSSSIFLLYFRRNLALPGYARNIGIDMATSEFIALIDVQTIPKPHWLEESLKMLANHEVFGVWGSTCFGASTCFETIVRDGFYGVLPRKTLPGSVFRRTVFYKVGQFIEWVRAGEDTEWLLRLEVMKIPMKLSSAPLVDYYGLTGLNLIKLLHKWYRNYNDAKQLPHFFPQKLLLWLFLYPLLVLAAFNWNSLVADWRMDSPFYIGHVTSIIAVSPFILYLIIRGLVLPLKRGVGLWKLFPTRFLAIALVCLMADLVKFMVFSIPKWIFQK
jgi:glycosyltransferase involved in cell wall biosynthesis